MNRPGKYLLSEVLGTEQTLKPEPKKESISADVESFLKCEHLIIGRIVFGTNKSAKSENVKIVENLSIS